mmetsp:Transcript_51780/g.120799  ORF Transcript_51780/g.120799 Transcript_51780/m.120799 type:complete len:257 (-) Transcript_51780:1151-1921(-)
MCHSHSKLAGELLASLLGVVGAIEVLAIDGALGSCHVTADDEVGGAVVLSNDHVLDGLAGSSHFHAVRQVGPSEHGVLLLRLSLQGLVGLDSNQAIDVARLRGAAGGVNQQDGVLHVLLSANQQLEVRSVDRVAVLEGDNLLVFWQSGSHLSRGLRGVSELGQLKAMNPAADVILADLLHEGGNGRVLQTAGAVALLGLHDLVGLVDGIGLQNGHLLSLPRQEQLVALVHAIHLWDVEGHGQPEELLLRQAHVLHN